MKIAILRALQLGDLLCAVPAFRALRAAHPQAELALVGLPWAREFVARFRRYLDSFIEFPGYPGMPERRCDPNALPAFFSDLRNRKFDLAIQMHGSGELTNPLVRLMGAAQSAGFYRKGAYCPDAERFLEWRDREHEILRNLRLLARLGVPASAARLEFPLYKPDLEEIAALRLKSYAVVHPGSQLASRRWPVSRFAEVADALAWEGLAIVLTGTEAERALTRQVSEAMRDPALDLAGCTTLGGVAALIAGARLLVSNDTGVSHIAAALQTPSVIIACGSDPHRWAPLDRQLHRVLYHDIACRPCAYADCPIGHPCATAVPARRVIDEALKVFACAA